MEEIDVDRYLPVSGLQHVVFCERQAALIAVERGWEENSQTLEGRSLHRRTDDNGPRRERRGDLVILRGVDLRSDELRLVGIADVVELRAAGDGSSGVPLFGVPGRWMPSPVEYKRGKPKWDHCDEVQVCAQAMCLEEMLGVTIPAGALFYGQNRHRMPVVFGNELRILVRAAARRLHEMVDSGLTPRADQSSRCRSCSLQRICMPELTTRSGAMSFLHRRLFGCNERGKH